MIASYYRQFCGYIKKNSKIKAIFVVLKRIKARANKNFINSMIFILISVEKVSSNEKKKHYYSASNKKKT